MCNHRHIRHALLVKAVVLVVVAHTVGCLKTAMALRLKEKMEEKVIVQQFNCL